MDAIGTIFFIIGIIIMIIGSIMFLIAAFSKSILWGIGCLLFNPVGLIFLIIHWQDAKYPFLIQLAGLPFLILGAFIKGF